MFYRARITEQKDGVFFVRFPGCEGLTTYGSTRKQAVKLAGEALEGWLEAHMVTGRVPPRCEAKAGTRIEVSAQLSTTLQIRWARDRLGLNQTELARRAGVTQQAIAKLENPDSNPTLATLDKVARALGMRLDVELLKEAS